MERTQAVNYLKELLKYCNDLSPEAVSFEASEKSGYDGCCVRIKGELPFSDKQVVEEIAAKHKFTVKEGKSEVFICTPKQTI